VTGYQELEIIFSFWCTHKTCYFCVRKLVYRVNYLYVMKNFCKLKELYRMIQEMENTIQTAHGLSVNECMAICKINSGCTSATELAEALSQSKSRMSKVLAGLEQKQLISRNFDKIDKRKIVFDLTKKGQEKAFEVESSEVVIPDFEVVYTSRECKEGEKI